MVTSVAIRVEAQDKAAPQTASQKMSQPYVGGHNNGQGCFAGTDVS